MMQAISCRSSRRDVPGKRGRGKRFVIFFLGNHESFRKCITFAPRKPSRCVNAQVAELVDAHVSGACAARRAGSIPVLGTENPVGNSNGVSCCRFAPARRCPPPARPLTPAAPLHALRQYLPGFRFFTPSESRSRRNELSLRRTSETSCYGEKNPQYRNRLRVQ